MQPVSLLYAATEPASAPFAAGSYDYFLNDAPAGVFEHWSIERLADGGTRTRVHRDANLFGSAIWVECDADAAGGAVTFRTRVVNTGRVNVRAAPQIDAVYWLEGDTVRVHRQIIGGPVTERIEPMPAGTVVFPLMRVFMAGVIEAVAAHAGEVVSVLVPDLADPNDPNRVLQPLFDPRRATRIGDEAGVAAGMAGLEGVAEPAVYQYMGGNYQDADARFVIGGHPAGMRILERYTWSPREGMLWRVQLHHEG